MALMDVPVIDPLMRAISALLRPGGRFVFTVQHPAFNSSAARPGLEGDDRHGDWTETRYVRIENYLHVPPGKGAGMPGEPTLHWYFHQPLHELFSACFAAGLVVDGVEEPGFEPGEDSNGPLLEKFHRYPTGDDSTGQAGQALMSARKAPGEESPGASPFLDLGN